VSAVVEVDVVEVEAVDVDDVVDAVVPAAALGDEPQAETTRAQAAPRVHRPSSAPPARTHVRAVSRTASNSGSFIDGESRRPT
jgi:hypothetical protein